MDTPSCLQPPGLVMALTRDARDVARLGFLDDVREFKASLFLAFAAATVADRDEAARSAHAVAARLRQMAASRQRDLRGLHCREGLVTPPGTSHRETAGA